MGRAPRKALYEAFDERPDLEFDHYLCEKLGWRSVREMRRGMAAAEYQAWSVYYARKAQQREMAMAKAG
jgi:hypothetical protein